jgi:tetratricopeptide (TPR) repeat protein
MRLRLVRLLPLTLCLGCAVLTPYSDNAFSTADAADPSTARAGEDKEGAIQESHRLLQAAAMHLEKGENAAALPCLTRYVEQNPDHVVMRSHLAELLLKLDKQEEAREQLERFVVDAQLQGEPACQQLAQGHIRLMEIAQKQGDEYAEHLNRGIGLYCIAQQVLGQPDGSDDPAAQKSLFKAIDELKSAAKLRPDEPRPQWYMHEAWCALGQSQPARQALRRARKLAVLGGLTPSEEESLALATENNW